MSANSKIEWTQATWNPVLGCSKKSPGCRGCYAIRQVHRLAGNPNPQIASANSGLTVLRGDALTWTGKVRLVERRLQVPVKRKQPTKYFVNSLSDLFHPSLPDDAIAEVFRVMYRCDWHTFQVLTKHGETNGRMVKTMRRVIETFGPLPRHIWLGVSVEDRARLKRIDLLRETPAAVRFVSFEPLLEDLGELNLQGIDLAIWGGESGTKARPCDIRWIRNGMRQASAQGCRNFVKQLGARPESRYLDFSHSEGPEVNEPMRLKDRKGGDPEEWPEDLRVRQMPEVR